MKKNLPPKWVAKFQYVRTHPVPVYTSTIEKVDRGGGKKWRELWEDSAIGALVHYSEYKLFPITKSKTMTQKQQADVLKRQQEMQLRERCLEMAGRYCGHKPRKQNHSQVISISSDEKSPTELIADAESFFKYIMNGKKK